MNDKLHIWFRELYDDVLHYKRHALFYDVLTPWIEKAQAAMSELGRFKTSAPFDSRDDAALAAMWNMYALGRANDLLLRSFQKGVTERRDPALHREQYEAFFTQIGLTLVVSDNFAPFHHEIVQVHQSREDDEPIGVLRQVWPGLMLGDMMFSRSGVEVIGGRQHIISGIAEKSTLYFAYHRVNRRTNDLSMGWGSNSQWRTNYRRDYRTANTWIYNEDGTNLLNARATPEKDRDGLTNLERMELCRNRCFIVISKPDQDLFPFDDRLEETATA